MIFPLTVETVRDLRQFALDIRRGCLMKPVQIFGSFYQGDDGACVFGAAMAAQHLLGYKVLWFDHPLVLTYADFRGIRPLRTFRSWIGAYCNDIRHLSRERIALIIERLARAYESRILSTIDSPKEPSFIR